MTAAGGGGASLDGIRAAIELLFESDGYVAAPRRVADGMQALPDIDDFLDALN